MALVNPLGGGTASGITVTTSILQSWQQLQANCKVIGEEKVIEFAQYKGAVTEWIGVTGSNVKNLHKRKIDDRILW